MFTCYLYFMLMLILIIRDYEQLNFSPVVGLHCCCVAAGRNIISIFIIEEQLNECMGIDFKIPD